MSTKNPFEIRTEVLHMAKDYLDKQHQLNMDFARQSFDAAVKAGKLAQESWQEHMPKMYSLDEVIKKAQELYGFVTSK